jgi:hypothetical protein
METLYNEPAEFRAGDTVTWLKTVEDYPPTDGWTLKYAFRSAASKFNVTAATSGTDYLSTITAADSAPLAAARYEWLAFVTKGSGSTLVQHSVDEGSARVLPNLSADVVYDARSDARKIYDDLIDKYKTLAGSGMQVQSYNVAGRGVTYNKPAEMLDAIKYWAAQVRAEDDAEAAANGLGSSRQVGVLFRKI